MYFVIRKNARGQYWWAAKGDNHETMAHSETLTSKATAEQSIATIRREAQTASVLDWTESMGAAEPS